MLTGDDIVSVLALGAMLYLAIKLVPILVVRTVTFLDWFFYVRPVQRRQKRGTAP